MIPQEINDKVNTILLSGMPISLCNADNNAVCNVKNAARRILKESMPTIREAIKAYMAGDSIDALVLPLLPIRCRIWYGVYAPYWLIHCYPVTAQDSEAEFTYYNDLINMYWDWKRQKWKKKDELSFTTMLPPTKGLITLDHRETAETIKSIKL